VLATVRGQKESLHVLADLLDDSGPTTRALLIEGAEGVGKSHTLNIAMRSAEERGYHTVGFVDGRDITGYPTFRYPTGATQPPEPLAGHPLPPDDGVPLMVGVDDAHMADPTRLRLDMRWLAKNRRPRTIWVVTTRIAGSGGGPAPCGRGAWSR
jgi:hypothetical protein